MLNLRTFVVLLLIGLLKANPSVVVEYDEEPDMDILKPGSNLDPTTDEPFSNSTSDDDEFSAEFGLEAQQTDRLRTSFQGPPVNYDGSKVYRITPQSSDEVALVDEIVASFKGADMWEPPVVERDCEVQVGAEFAEAFERRLQEADLAFEVAVDDLGQSIGEESLLNDEARMERSGDEIVGTFADLGQIYKWMAAKCRQYGQLTKCGKVAGLTHQGRYIKYMKIGAQTCSEKKIIFVEAAMHAREWLATATVVSIMSKLLNGYDKDAKVTRLLDTYDWYILPVANPDGYAFSHSGDRLWRKNRAPSKIAKKCIGVDLNRNWRHRFAAEGVNNDPCHPSLYPGPSAFSELESKALGKFLTSLKEKGDFKAFFSFHAYGNYWLIPFASGPKPEDYDELERVGRIGVRALSQVNNAKWKLGTPGDVLYPASGSSMDWVKAKLGVKYAYCLEVRQGSTPPKNGKKQIGFIARPEDIELSANECWAGITAAILAME